MPTPENPMESAKALTIRNILIALAATAVVGALLFLLWPDKQAGQTVEEARGTITETVEGLSDIAPYHYEETKKKGGEIREQVHNEVREMSRDAVADGLNAELELYRRERGVGTGQ